MSKLDERRKKYDIPPLSYLPLGKNVLIYRIEANDKTPGGLHIPDAYKPVYSRGILLAAGLEARDILAGGLVEIGDEVCFGQYALRDRETAERTAGIAPRTIGECKVEDVLGSVDALERVKDYDVVYVENSEGEGLRIYQKKGK